ncbi:glutamine-dependent carbamoyl-phosphate synthetase [Trypanosoma theileri]|uniref:Glutamine-dependent carbamoyl-phosphate synthetase n=1 Tax=Trypanosoma theileri TaxID=67003 RepID=A0A1X0P452_9TRYP|nr:glutamine-dependent carbamoyl-phosphate synthetase [Trypanosoma theileri]ORC91716.1 glutamine-dependent carbamoyl-phosphate synthetase [Trypanosoma theileri]
MFVQYRRKIYCLSCLIFFSFTVLVSAYWEFAENDVAQVQPTWSWCIRNMGRYAFPVNSTYFKWLENPCCFVDMDVKRIQQDVLFRERQNCFVFIGDSVAYRNFGFVVNSFLPFGHINGYERIRNVPDHINISGPISEFKLMSLNISSDSHVETFVNSRDSNISKVRYTSVHYYKNRYISLLSPLIESIINQTDDGIVLIYVGTWDLNWQINNRERVPNLGGPSRHFPTAIKYWTKYVRVLMEAIQRALKRKPLNRRPIIMILEQFSLYCRASRFVGRSNMFKRCSDFTQPIVVPLYRRVVAAMAWHMNIPVIPSEHYFKDNYKYCKISDGVHLDEECMMTVQQHIWNAYLLFRRNRVVQGLLPAFRELPDPMTFVSAETYAEWRHHLDDVESGNTENNELLQVEMGTAFIALLWFFALMFILGILLSSKCNRSSMRREESSGRNNSLY